ncbi:ankyrin repeat domain-containing protein [Skeletonema marinoi]|uniref:Ankyrin repeat domain-containing protein n=1 Tax=Skeletonema marinoi TaxID=267567 RepID=A0AAD9D574_9STRA|nr:ankyrin repeat domain-containing protein [Skeletonema marinoi]
MHYASKKGHVDVVRQLIESGATVNAKDNGENTPLHWACSNGHMDVAKLLIENGAEFNAKNNEGITPLDLAVEMNLDVVKLLQIQNKNGAIGNVESFAKKAKKVVAKKAVKVGARAIGAAIAEELFCVAIAIGEAM